jgi:uncharacterized protein (TIGR02246 family)
MSVSEDVLQRLEQLAGRVRELEDREAIRNVIAAYGPAVDRGDSAGAAALFTDEGAYDVGGYGVHSGRDVIEALFDGDVHQGLIKNGAAHFLSPVRIDLNGDSAIAIGYSAVFVWVDGAFKAHRIAANRWEMQRDRDGWRVARRVNRLLDGDADSRALLG